jgi:hypothetical protein
MRRRMTLLITAAIMAISMSLAAAGAALADPPPPGGCTKERGTINSMSYPCSPKCLERRFADVRLEEPILPLPIGSLRILD